MGNYLHFAMQFILKIAWHYFFKTGCCTKQSIMKKLNKLVFIDNDHSANEHHELVSRNADVAHEVLSFTDSNTALEYLSYTPHTPKFPELIFINVHIPNGYRFIKEVKRFSAYDESHTRISYLVPTLNSEDITIFFKYGMKHFYFKPLGEYEMVKVIREIFSL